MSLTQERWTIKESFNFSFRKQFFLKNSLSWLPKLHSIFNRQKNINRRTDQFEIFTHEFSFHKKPNKVQFFPLANSVTKNYKSNLFVSKTPTSTFVSVHISNEKFRGSKSISHSHESSFLLHTLTGACADVFIAACRVYTITQGKRV